MTPPTFQELLTSQEARDRVTKFRPVEGRGTHFMRSNGALETYQSNDVTAYAIWQGWLTEAAPPPEPMVFKRVMYFNVYESNVGLTSFHSRKDADYHNNHARDRLACVRVEITAIEGQYDD